MVYHRFQRSLLLLICHLLITPAFAQPDSDQQRLDDLILVQQQLQTELQSTTTELQRLQKQAEPNRAKYLKAQSEVIAATARHAENPTEHTQSKINNAEFKLALAEHKLNKFNGQLGDLKLKLQQTQQQLQATEQSIAQLNKADGRRLSLQKTANTDAAKTALGNAEPSQVIIAGVEAAAGTPLSTRKMVAKDAELAGKGATKPVISDTSSDAAAMPALALSTPAKPEPISSPGAKNAITLLLDRQQIYDHQQSINQLVTADETEKTSRNNRVMTIKPVAASSSSQSTADTNLQLIPISNNIYRGVTTLASGDTVFIIGFNRWRQTIPATAFNGAEHVFIFNNSVSKKPQLVYYPQALENQP